MGAGGAVRDTARKVRERVQAWPKWVRIPIGGLFLIGGVLGFLPVLGFWMIPLGLAILAMDIPIAGRIYRWFRRKVVQVIRYFRGRRGSAH